MKRVKSFGGKNPTNYDGMDDSNGATTKLSGKNHDSDKKTNRTKHTENLANQQSKSDAHLAKIEKQVAELNSKFNSIKLASKVSVIASIVALILGARVFLSLKDLNRLKDEFSQKTAALINDLSDNETRIYTLADDLNSLKNDYQKLVEENEMINTSLAQYANDNELLKEELSQKMAVLTNDSSSTETRFSNLANDLNNLRADYQKLVEENKRIITDLETNKNRFAEIMENQDREINDFESVPILNENNLSQSNLQNMPEIDEPEIEPNEAKSEAPLAEKNDDLQSYEEDKAETSTLNDAQKPEGLIKRIISKIFSFFARK